MNGTDVPLRGQTSDLNAPNYVNRDQGDYALYFAVNGLSHNNPLVSYDIPAGWVTFYVEYIGHCEHCGFRHGQLREETKLGLIRVWKA